MLLLSNIILQVVFKIIIMLNFSSNNNNSSSKWLPKHNLLPKKRKRKDFSLNYLEVAKSKKILYPQLTQPLHMFLTHKIHRTTVLHKFQLAIIISLLKLNISIIL